MSEQPNCNVLQAPPQASGILPKYTGIGDVGNLQSSFYGLVELMP